MHKKLLISLLLPSLLLAQQPPQYTLISQNDYNQITQQSEQEIQQLITQLKPYQTHSDYLNQLITQSVHFFMNRPYEGKGADGEGNWHAGDITHQTGVHIQQDPIYRTDSFVCTTLVNVVLAFINANTLQDYQKNILTIKYGAADEPPSSIHYYNRNNFISADFNPVNQKNGLLNNVTSQGVFKSLAKKTSAIIDRQQWFTYQMKPDRIKNTVRVFSEENAALMIKDAQNQYPAPFHRFTPQKVTIDYIPKETLVQKIILGNGKIIYQPNEKLIRQIPTPAVVEIVRDVRQWKVGNKNITEVIGSGINVSHVGLLYQEHFQYDQMIYPQIYCVKKGNQKVCTVQPILCKKQTGCTEIMFANATDIYPNSYFYYRDTKGNYHCDKTPPSQVLSTAANRVIALPLGEYLTMYQHDQYIFINEPSILGIHVEKINNKCRAD